MAGLAAVTFGYAAGVAGNTRDRLRNGRAVKSQVKAGPQQRTEIVLLVQMFRGRVVDISAGDIMIEISGQAQKIEKFIDLMRPYGII